MSYGIYLNSASGDQVVNNTIRNAVSAGIYFFGTGNTYDTLENNTISGSSGGSSIYFESNSGSTYFNNATSNALGNATYGIVLYTYNGNLYNTRVLNNTCKNMSDSCVYISRAGFTVTNNEIINNTASGSPYGIHFNNEGTNNNFSGNVLNGTTYPLYIVAGSTGNIFRNNTFINDVTSNFIYDNGASNTFANLTLWRLGSYINLPSTYTLAQ